MAQDSWSTNCEGVAGIFRIWEGTSHRGVCSHYHRSTFCKTGIKTDTPHSHPQTFWTQNALNCNKNIYIYIIICAKKSSCWTISKLIKSIWKIVSYPTYDQEVVKKKNQAHVSSTAWKERAIPWQTPRHRVVGSNPEETTQRANNTTYHILSETPQHVNNSWQRKLTCLTAFSQHAITLLTF